LQRALTKGELIGGLDAVEARRILKRFGHEALSLEQAARHCEIDISTAPVLLGQLVAEGYLKVTQGTIESWNITSKATLLFDKSTTRVLKRTKAQEKLQALLARVKELNENAYYLYTVARLGVFGSYLTDKDLLGDLDVCLILEPRETNQAQHMKLKEARINRAFAEGQRLSSLGDELLYPFIECFKFLKGRSPKLNLAEYSSIETLDCTVEWIYVSNGEDVAPSSLNPEVFKPYLCSAGVFVEFVATRACQIGTINFAKGDKVNLKTKRPCSFGWDAKPRSTDEWVSITKGFPPQMLSTTELVELAEALYVNRRVIYYCRAQEAEEFMTRETCKGCGSQSWQMHLVDYPVIFCNHCYEMVSFYWKAPRIVRN
jgi:predicted nucleotidyltransferase